MVEKKVNRIVFIIIAVILVIAFVFSLLTMALKKTTSTVNRKKRTETVMKAGGMEVGADWFTLFCAEVIESDDFPEMSKSAVSNEALAQSVKAKAQEYAAEYCGLVTEAKNRGISLTDEECSAIRKNAEEKIKGDSADEFFGEYYGMDFERFLEFKEGWALAEKMVTALRDEADDNEEALKEAYEKNITTLAFARVKMIYFDLTTVDEGTLGLKKATAEDVISQINVENSKFDSLYGTCGDTYIKNDDNGLSVIDGEAAVKFPELYNTAVSGTVGEVYLISDDKNIFIFKIEEQFGFDFFKDSEELKKIAADTAAKEVTEKCIAAAKAEIEVLNEMRDVNIAPLIIEGQEKYAG